MPPAGCCLRRKRHCLPCLVVHSGIGCSPVVVPCQSPLQDDFLWLCQRRVLRRTALPLCSIDLGCSSGSRKSEDPQQSQSLNLTKLPKLEPTASWRFAVQAPDPPDPRWAGCPVSPKARPRPARDHPPGSKLLQGKKLSKLVEILGSREHPYSLYESTTAKEASAAAPSPQTNSK